MKANLKRLTGNFLLCCGVGAATWLLPMDAHAQRRGGFSSGDFIRGMDKNGNGLIEPDELSDRSREFVKRAAERAGLDINKPLPVDKLSEAFTQMRAEREQSGERGPGGDRGGFGDRGSSGDRERGRDWGRDRDGGSRSEGDRSRDSGDRGRESSRTESRPPEPTTQGFGVPDDMPKVPGFDVPLSQDDAYIVKRFEPSVIEYVERMLSEQDVNKDGFIDSVEWKAGRWSTPPETSDLNKDNRLSKLELCIRVSKRFGGDREAPSSGSDSGSGSAPASSSSSSGGPTSSSSSGSSGDTSKYRAYAEGLIKQHDADKSGMLEKSKGEWDKLREEQREADTNRDGVITLDELVAKLQAYGGGSSRGSSSSSSGYSSRSSSSSSRSSWWKQDSAAASEPKKSYRFLSPTERLPKGLPDWFIRNDADGDGQIMMSEYASTWTESTAAEFMRLDLDGDGIITPHEALQQGQR